MSNTVALKKKEFLYEITFLSIYCDQCDTKKLTHKRNITKNLTTISIISFFSSDKTCFLAKFSWVELRIHFQNVLSIKFQDSISKATKDQNEYPYNTWFSNKKCYSDI